MYAATSPAIAGPARRCWNASATTSDPFIASLVAHAAFSGADCGVDSARVVELAEQAARSQACGRLVGLYSRAALRRAGRLDEAIPVRPGDERQSPLARMPLVAAMRRVDRASAGDAGRT